MCPSLLPQINSVRHGADPSIKTCSNGAGGKTACHICAEKLDFESLSSLFSSSTCIRPNANALDQFGRTPMYVALMDGVSVGNKRNYQALNNCLDVLEANGGHFYGQDFGSIGLNHPLYHLASGWRDLDLQIFLTRQANKMIEFFNATYSNGESISHMYQYPIHAALINLKRKVEEFRIAALKELSSPLYLPIVEGEMLTNTLRSLLDHGFEPNERVHTSNEGSEEALALLNSVIGFSPLHILAATALEFDSFWKTLAEPRISDSLFVAWSQKFKEIIWACSGVLISCGARFDLGLPSDECQDDVDEHARMKKEKRCERKDNKKSSLLFSSEIHDKIKLNKDNGSLVLLLGGNVRLTCARTQFMDLKPVLDTGGISLEEPDVSSRNSRGLWSSNFHGKSCEICWTPFGTLYNRRHWCRASKRDVCDECSKKRIIKKDRTGSMTEVRVSDGQFLLRLHYRKLSRSFIDVESWKPSSETLNLHARIDPSSTSKNLEKLTKSTPENLQSSLQETRHQLEERGQKVSNLSEKTAALANASKSFADMARDLEKSNRQGFFW